VSKDISNGIRNSWESNFNLNPAISPNSPQLGYSNFDLRNRLVGSMAMNLHWNKMQTTSLAFFYQGQSGNPYTLIYQSPPEAVDQMLHCLIFQKISRISVWQIIH